MKLFRTIGKGINTVGGGTVKGIVNVIGSTVDKKNEHIGSYIKDLGHRVVHYSQKVIENTCHLADGVTNSTYGLAKKDRERQTSGVEDIKDASVNMLNGMVNGIKFTGKSLNTTVTGIVDKDRVQVIEGLKDIGKVGFVATLGIGVIDLIVIDDIEATEIDTRNMGLEGMKHEETNIEFQKKIVETNTGELQSGVFPQFNAVHEYQLPNEMLLESDPTHIKLASEDLYKAIQNNPSLLVELNFTEKDISMLNSDITPVGYDWHHSEDLGVMQLVEEEIHQKTGHTGGRQIWGGGTEAR